ncbi:hypothetical protein J2S49_000736 [Arcanobacterium wilhelmae]|uniref:Uncharacterized protein n=1 Tax=Arcanobacterium wilhelmae TaxID=1803177 RepID=A0ABT9NAB4_9ACTO|nr:hypothetical protein [Arcanobacterium wilhelmae]MDP9800660.1 hypothetical protein [Arcanobacterium wilhelmae]WFN90063.1 hypothetical protein P8A24_07665 [Arcanobacterium wilhelmae]
MSSHPRRPAQLEPEQIERIPGETDTAYNSELAHTTAQAIVPLPGVFREDDPGVDDRILAMVRSEGIDVIAESWVRSPEDSLPGILWRGFLLSEWIRRYPDAVSERLAAAKQVSEREVKASPDQVRQEWANVFEGAYSGDFGKVLADSAHLTSVLAQVEPAWIKNDMHPLATEVTRRKTAMIVTSEEFLRAAELYRGGELN